MPSWIPFWSALLANKGLYSKNRSKLLPTGHISCHNSWLCPAFLVVYSVVKSSLNISGYVLWSRYATGLRSRVQRSAVCKRLSQWPRPLPGTWTPSFKVSYNNSIHSVPLQNRPPPLQIPSPRPLPVLPSSATLSISSSDSTLFFSLCSLLHFFLPPNRRFVYIW